MSEAANELEMMELVLKDERENKAIYYVPRPKHLQFFNYGTEKRERMFAAGNGVGKSEAGAFEDAIHLTGNYPDWWKGIRYNRPISMWIASETGVLSRDVVQSKLCGKYGVVSAFGTGMIPKKAFADKPTLARGVTDAFDTIQVVHKTNGVEDGVSTCQFKSFEQGREKFQGENLDYGHCDEEPPMDIYAEFLARIRGNPLARMAVTFTPLHGRTELYNRFASPHPDRVMVTMSLDDADWYSEEQKRQMIDGYPTHEREARRYGVPLLGEGRVFLYDEAMFKEPFIDPKDVPAHWFKIWGIDFGVNHPFAAALLLWDKDLDTLHVHQAFRIRASDNTPYMSQPMFHAAQMKRYGASVPVAWPHDGHQRRQQSVGSAQATSTLYKAQGLNMLGVHSTHPTGGYGVEPIITEIDQRIITGRFKVSAHLSDWFEEYRFYHRDNGLIVPINDDILSATWKAVMMKRMAKTVPLGNWVPNRKDRNRSGPGGLDADAGDRYFGIDA